MKLQSFDETLYRHLQTPEFAAAYLQDAYEESIEEFLIALRKYVQANGGFKHCAAEANLAREAVYRMLSAGGNPELRSIDAILKAYGLRFGIQPRAGTEDTEAVPELVHPAV